MSTAKGPDVYRESLGIMAIGLVGLLIQSEPVIAQNLSQAWTWCANKNNESPDLQIGGCTTVIQLGGQGRDNLVIAFLNRGNGYYAKQDYDRAIADYEQAIKLDSKSVFAFRNRGLSYFNKKDYDRAIADDSRALELNPKYADAFNDRGIAYNAKGDQDHAIADYDAAIRLNPKFALAYENRGNAYKAKGDEVHAAADYNEANKLDPKFSAAPATSAFAGPRTTYQLLSLFGDVFERIRADYVTPVSGRNLTKAGIKGMLSAAGLPETFALDPLCERLADVSDKRSDYVDTERALNCFGDAFERIRAQDGGKVTEEKIIFGAISRMLTELDPHSRYMDARSFSDTQKQTRGEFGSPGMEITGRYNDIEVVSPLDGSPAAKAGIRAGDIITAIDNVPIHGITLDDAVDKLRGPVGSVVKLTVARKSVEKPIEFTIVRAIVVVHPVQGTAIDDVGYIRIKQFNEQTTNELKKAIADLQGRITPGRLKGYVIDLRNDPGGFLDQAISVADTFLERGEILHVRGRNLEETQRFNARPGDLAGGKPLILLMNGGSAGASEFVIGALQDHRRATVVGTRSFGEGSVQTVIPLGENNGALRLTTALMFTPSGRSIQAQGIVPDIEILQDVPDELKTDQSAGEAALPGHLKGAGEEASGSQSYVPANQIDDKALHVAIELLRGVQKNAAFPPVANSPPVR
jgi:carboxyl-terminal processing protease